MEDTKLVQATKQGDLNAFNELVLNYQDHVFNLARRILENQDLAEDVTQDTFITAFHKINQFRGGSFRAWLLKIATNLCYDEMRAWKRHPHLPLEPIDKENNINESPYWIKDPDPLPEEAVEIRDLQNLLERGLNQLPLKFRLIVALVDVHQMDYQEASRITGIPIGTVKSRLARGRMQLSSLLQITIKPYISEPNIFKTTTAKPPFRIE